MLILLSLSGEEVIVAVPEGALPGEELEIPLPPQAVALEMGVSFVYRFFEAQAKNCISRVFVTRQ